MPAPEPLWTVEDQAARLAELVSHDGDVKEAPLRRDKAENLNYALAATINGIAAGLRNTG